MSRAQNATLASTGAATLALLVACGGDITVVDVDGGTGGTAASSTSSSASGSTSTSSTSSSSGSGCSCESYCYVMQSCGYAGVECQAFCADLDPTFMQCVCGVSACPDIELCPGSGG